MGVAKPGIPGDKSRCVSAAAAVSRRHSSSQAVTAQSKSHFVIHRFKVLPLTDVMVVKSFQDHNLTTYLPTYLPAYLPTYLPTHVLNTKENNQNLLGHGALYGIALNIPGVTGKHQRDDNGAVTVLHTEINAKLFANKNILNEIRPTEQSSNSYKQD
jgi:hypothetical protein